MIPTYDCAELLRETLGSVLVQDPGPDEMQIEVVDDHSTRDDPEAVVRAVGGGRVGFHRQARNVGTAANFNTCLERSRGTVVHVLHGDDLVLDGFYARLRPVFDDPAVGAAFCRHIYLDASGAHRELSPLEQPVSGRLAGGVALLASEQRIMTPSIVVRREAYERLGGFDEQLVCAEDWEMWVRVAARHAVWYEVEPLAAYRMHDNSNTGRHVRSGADIAFTRRAIELFREHLPPEIADEVTTSALRTYAMSAVETGQRLLARHDVAGAFAQFREALRCDASPRVWRRLAGAVGRALATGSRS
jgi:glycosyltransferase involved in cell wall biosynthesis